MLLSFRQTFLLLIVIGIINRLNCYFDQNFRAMGLWKQNQNTQMFFHVYHQWLAIYLVRIVLFCFRLWPSITEWKSAWKRKYCKYKTTQRAIIKVQTLIFRAQFWMWRWTTCSICLNEHMHVPIICWLSWRSVWWKFFSESYSFTAHRIKSDYSSNKIYITRHCSAIVLHW